MQVQKIDLATKLGVLTAPVIKHKNGFYTIQVRLPVEVCSRLGADATLEFSRTNMGQAKLNFRDTSPEILRVYTSEEITDPGTDWKTAHLNGKLDLTHLTIYKS